MQALNHKSRVIHALKSEEAERGYLRTTCGQRGYIAREAWSFIEDQKAKYLLDGHVCRKCGLCDRSKEEDVVTQMRHSGEMDRDCNDGIVYGGES